MPAEPLNKFGLQLGDVKAPWQEDGRGYRGPGSRVDQAIETPGSDVKRSPRQPLFPEAVSTSVTDAATAIPRIAFILSNVSTTENGVVTYKIKVADGKIKGEFPAGMGSDNYVLTLTDPSDSIIYAGATFNPTTLDLTSRFLGVSTAADFPESRTESPTSGFLYWQLGFTFLDTDNVFQFLNTRVGDINFEFAYGAFNGQPALLPIDSGPGWLDLSFM